MLRLIIGEIKSWLYELELKAEQSSGVALGLYIAYIGISITVGIIDVSEIFSDHPKLLFPTIYSAIVLFALGMDFIHFRIIKAQRFELDARRRFIADLYEPSKGRYRIINWHQKYIIRDNGDGVNIRTLKLGYEGKSISCYELTFGNNNKYGLDLKKANVQAFDETKKRKLPRVTFKIADKEARSLILLTPPLTKKNGESELFIKIPIPHVWDDLMKRKRDHGHMVVNQPTDKFTMEFVAPEGYVFDMDRVRFSPAAQKESIRVDGNGHQCLKATFKAPNQGGYGFEIAIKAAI